MAAQPVRLRPKVRAVDHSGASQEDEDLWVVEAVRETELVLVNQRTLIRIILGLDNVRSFQSPDFLLLRCDIAIVGGQVRFEPHLPTRAPRPSPEAVLLQAVRDAMPAVPGSWSWPPSILDDPDARRSWFAEGVRDEAGAVLLPSPTNPTPGVWIHIPKAYLLEARRKLVEASQAEIDDPLDG